MTRAATWACLAVVGCWPAVSPPAGGADLDFVRVNVPAGGLREVPLEGLRHVPMPLAEFDDAVARLGARGGGAREPLAAEATYTLTLDAAGRLGGTLEFDLGVDGVWPTTWLPLGAVTAAAGTIRTADGTGEATIFCLPDGETAIRTPGPGRYACTIRVDPGSQDVPRRVPLLPALVTTIMLDLPAAVRPIVTGSDAATTTVEPVAERPGSWRIVRGPVAAGGTLPLVLWDDRRLPAPITAWNAITIGGRQAEVLARIEPSAAWTPERFELAVAPTLRVTGVTTAADGLPVAWTRGADTIAITPPDRIVGGRSGIVLTAVAPIATGEAVSLPVLQPALGRWGGGGARVVVEPALALERLEASDCLPVAAVVGDRWPLPARAVATVSAGPEPAVVHLEHQSPAARARVVVGPREAILDIARVTTADISPGTVLGRTTADVQVVAGQVFDITADVARGWFIDSVEALDAPRGRDGELRAAPGRPLEWRVVRSPQGSELRIGMTEAATPRRGIGLRISGHRSGLPLGAEFTSDDIDMVRFPGEQAMLELQVGPTAVLESASGPLGLEALPARLAPLSGLASPRARIAAGDRSPAVRTRLVRRRPPVEAEVSVDLVARDERLAETFSFSCRPVAGELDAVVVHFSEPMGSGLEWSMSDPLAGSLAAQPLDPGDATRGDLRSEQAVAESWLVELRPATTAAVRFQAVRTVPLRGAVPVPLAWVEAAEDPGGTVTIRGAVGARPEITNRRLRELPPTAEAEPGELELTYGGPRTLAGDEAAADVLPPAVAAAARAWAWRQSTVCWCYESGGLEWETTFELENLGRESVTLTPPLGLQVERVTVGDEPVAVDLTGSGPGGIAIPLLRDSGRIGVRVRGVGRADERLGWWRLGDVSCGVDVPVLERDATLMLPPGLVTTIGTDSSGPLARLLNAGGDPADDRSTSRGFHGVGLADGGTAGVVVIRRRLIWSLAIAAGCGALLLALAIGRRRGPAAIAACGVAAVAAIWCGAPWDAVARATLWGGVVGTWLAAGAGRDRPLTVALLAAAALGGPAARDTVAGENPPLRVFITPGDDGGTALVPEPLFRRLVETAAQGLPSLRVLGTETVASAGGWRVVLDLQADAGGLLLLDQADSGATWSRIHAGSPGLEVTIDAGGGVARVLAAHAGGHRLELDLLPGSARMGDVESLTARLPPAPRAVLRIDEAGAGAAVGDDWQCDRAGPDGAWLPLAGSGEFDLAGAARVRLVRPIDPGLTLASSPSAAVSFNDISWQAGECRVAASFKVGSEGTIVRSLVLRADAALEPVAGALVARPLGGGRHLVEIPEPRAGQRRLAVEFRMPLADAVGVFDAPFAWLEGVETDVRTARLRTEAGLEAAAELPPGMALVRPRAEDGADTSAVWRCDAVAGGDTAAAELRPRITIRRLASRPRAAQNLLIGFADGQLGLRLVYQVEAADIPLVEIPVQLPPAAVVDDIVLSRRSAGTEGEPDWRRVDLFWSRVAADRIVAVAQRPEAGPHRLEVAARLPIRPASRGRLPLARVADDDLPLEVRWQAESGMSVTVEAEPRPGDAAGDRLELSGGQPAPAYLLSRDDLPPALPAKPLDAAPPAVDSRPAVAVVPRAVVDVAIDSSGRVWGLARFDLLAREPLVTVAMPAGLRLFGLRADGREVTATPLGGNTWQVRLPDVGWPRSLVAVIAGSVGTGVLRGEPVALEPPRLVGLPSAAVLWSLRAPPGLAVRVSEPARVLDEAALRDWNTSAGEPVGAALDAAIKASSAGQRQRLEAHVAARDAGVGPTGERDWYEAWLGSAALETERVRIAANPDGSVTFRAVPAETGPRAARGLATAAILAGVVACWLAARRWRAAATRVASFVHRWWWVAAGMAWILLLEPVAPGVAMLLLGGGVAISQAVVRRPSPAARAGGGSTLTFVAE